MKIKNPDNIAMENKDIMINLSMFENFPLSNLKNTNVINHINRLINMYHPDDGIVAYERLLKTLLFLSENFDSKTQQQIISTVPLPKGASNDSIKDVIYKTTGFIEIANKIKIYQKSNVVLNNKLNSEDATDKTRIHLNRNMLMGLPTQNPESNENFIPSVCEVFRGFPPNEISMIHSHVRNVNYMYDTLDYDTPCIEPFVDISQNFLPHTDQQADLMKHQSNLKFKWVHTPHVLCKKSNYQESFSSSMDNKCFQSSLHRVNSYNQWNVVNVPHTSHQ
ncbi:uncharacterized protein LOC116424335 [Nomia melanderi]|uniref:uncharacterized protein LOC116424335 n=1 Tax=Nomia melanderi TaxID=2448451 RepID=UPI001303FDA4|nr:uncharacterized protein LOC116424335 [Nomia melanderi]